MALRTVGLLLCIFSSIAAFAVGPVGAIAGVLDLRTQLNKPETVVRLSGEWAFNWQVFDQGYPRDTSSYINVPGHWGRPSGKGMWEPKLGYGTYSLRVMLPEREGTWALYIPPINSAYRLFINGELKAQVGIPDSSRRMNPSLLSRTVQCFVPGDELRLVLHVSNYNFVSGGMSIPILLGRPAAVERSCQKTLLISSALMGSLLIMCFYHLFLYFFLRKDSGALYFAGICFFMALRESFAGYAVFFSIFSGVDHGWSLKILYSTFPLGLLCFASYFKTLFPAYSRWLRLLITLVCTLFLANILASNNSWYGRFLPLLSFLFALQLTYVVYLITNKNPLKARENVLIIVGISSLMTCLVNDVLFEAGIINSWFLLPAGFFIFILCQALLLTLKFSDALLLSEKLNVALVKAAEKKKMEEIKNRFFANMTHELRTPLTLILAPVEKLLKDVSGRNSLQKPLKSIYRNASHLLNLINQLLDINKIGSGAMTAAYTREHILSKLDSLYDSFNPLATQKEITLIVKTEDLPEALYMDGEKFDRIMSNLLSNAMRFTRSGGEVEVTVRMDASSLDIRVSDTGVGIPADQLPFIFDRFYQVTNRELPAGGTGIGLSLVKELLDLLGGEIGVTSTPGVGTVFHIRYPVISAEFDHRLPGNDSTKGHTEVRCPHPAGEITELATRSTNAEHTASLVIADDNEELLELMVDILSERYQIYSAPDGAEAWSYVQEKLPDLVISDVMMPEIDGYTLCRLVKETPATNHIGVILLTARTDTDSKVRGLTYRANDYLTKPFHVDELLLRIENMLAHQDVLKEYFRQQLAAPVDQQQNQWPEHPFLTALYNAIEENLDNPRYSVDDLASRMAVSTRTLNRKLAALTGLTTNEVIRNYRLKKSIALLAAGFSVSECAYKVGFESPSYFGKCFKELYKETPSSYIKR